MNIKEDGCVKMDLEYCDSLNDMDKAERKKQKAIELMNKLDIYKPYIKGFEKDDTICYFENFGGFWAWQEPELMEKVKEFEEEYNRLVNAVTHEYLEFGECYDFLYVSNEEEEWEYILEEFDSKKFYACAYVWNKDNDLCSEFGTIALQSVGGGIRRIG